MNNRCATSSPPSRRAGLTLIEVVAAIAILGSVLVGIVLAKSRHTRQLALAERKQQAVRAADRLITRWWTREQGIPVGEQGVLKSDKSLHWHTREMPNRRLNHLDARVVRVSLHVADPARSQLPPKDHQLITVDLVLPTSRSGQSDGDGAPGATNFDKLRERGDDPNGEVERGRSRGTSEGANAFDTNHEGIKRRDSPLRQGGAP